MSLSGGGLNGERIAYVACALAYFALHLAILARRPPHRSRADWHNMVTTVMVGVPLAVAAAVVITSLLRS